MKKAVLVDIDGTLANNDHRKHFVEGAAKKDWDSFFKAMDKDTHHQWCMDLLWCLSEELDVEIIYITGRAEKYREMTTDFISHGDLPPFANLYMRQDSDRRQATEVKLEIYEKYVKGNYHVMFCLEDCASVTAMWRAQGLTVLQCAEGNF